MAVVVVDHKVTPKDLEIAKQEYGEFIKIVVDVSTQAITIGGEWHADGEAQLLNLGSKQSDLWGGGIDLLTNEITFSAMTNIKPGVNSGHVILDSQTRENFVRIVNKYLI